MGLPGIGQHQGWRSSVTETDMATLSALYGKERFSSKINMFLVK